MEFKQVEIANHKRKILDAMESNTNENDNFATKVLSKKNVEKRNVEEVRRKNQTYLFSKLPTWATRFKVTFSRKLIFLKILT